MDFDRLLQKREQLAKMWDTIPQVAKEKLERSFDIEYAHNSTAIEGNTLTLIQTKAILEDGLSVGGKTLREIYEVANHNKAFSYVKQCVAEGRPLDEPTSCPAHGKYSHRRRVPQRGGAHHGRGLQASCPQGDVYSSQKLLC